MTVKIMALISVKPGEEERFVAAAQACVAGSRTEPGNLRYDLWRETAGEGRFVFDELYADEDAIRAHRESDHYKAFGPALRDLLTARPTVVVVNGVDVA